MTHFQKIPRVHHNTRRVLQMKRKKLAAFGLVIALTISSSSTVFATTAPDFSGTEEYMVQQAEKIETETSSEDGSEKTDPAIGQNQTETEEDETTGNDESDAKIQNPSEDVSGVQPGENPDTNLSPEDSAQQTQGSTGEDVQQSSGTEQQTSMASPDESAVADQEETLAVYSADEITELQQELASYTNDGVLLMAAAPSTIDGVATTDIVNAAKVMIRKYEGGYSSVNANDNGALSIGKMQWHGDRAKSLLRIIIAGDAENAKLILQGTSLYDEIMSDGSWSKRVLNSTETAAMKNLLATGQSQLAQDVQEDTDVTAYINDVYNRGIRNAAAIVYLADIENQSGSGGVNTILSYAKNFGNLGDLTLNEIHITTVCYAYTNRNSWISQSDTNRKSYLTRRFNAYVDASGLGWTYCKAGDYRMPSTSPATNKIGIQWLQNALNQYQNAGLSLDGSYGPATKDAVRNFQQEAGLSVDGDAGLDTVRELIRRLYFNQAIYGRSEVIRDTVTGLTQDENGTWIYAVNGKIDRTYTGLAQNEYGWWYILNGVLDFSYQGFGQNGDSWWYCRGGQVHFDDNGVIEGTVNKTYGWWKVVNSQVIFDNDVCQNSNGWWKISNGKVDFSYTGLAQNASGWWYIHDGAVDFNYTGFGQNGNSWWYCRGGQVHFDDTDVIEGFVNGTYGWWKVVDSQVIFDNDVCQNNNGWWKISDGKVDFGYTGLAQNEHGWWYIHDGAVDFDKNSVLEGTVNGDTAWWNVRGGQVIFKSTVADNEVGWWRIDNGKVNFGYNGIAQNDFGWWYIRKGQVDFSYSGTVKVTSGTYQVVNGKVNR